MEKYQKLVQLDFYHDYFDGWAGNQFMVRPTVETNLELKKAQLMVVADTRGISILVPTDSETPTKLKDTVESKFRFSFLVSAKDPTFLNYTQLPLSLSGSKAYYWTNDSRQKQPTIIATENGYKVRETDGVGIAPKKFQFTFQKPVEEGTVTLNNSKGEVISAIEVQADQPLPYLNIDVSPYEEGIFEIIVNNEVVHEFFALDTVIGDHFLGIVTIANDAQIFPETKLVDDAGTMTPRTFQLNFPARSTHWKYYIIKKGAALAEDLAIVNGSKEAVFEGPSNSTLPTGDEAEVFVSTGALALKARSDYKFELRRGYDGTAGSGSKLIARLPVADPVRIIPDTPTNRVFSEIYVYL